MKVSAGIAILYLDKVLMAHAKSSPWYKSYTPPKGGVEEGESHIDAAVRELQEETGIRVDKRKLLSPVEVPYIDNRGKTYKIVVLFPMRIESLEEIGLKEEKVPLSQLQVEEVDEVRFMEENELIVRALPRYLETLKSLINLC
jgi:ADP-ribose pyrophosphatase YjhB (NUDIX family)